MAWDKYPYTDFHEMNLSWVIARLKEVMERLDNFISLNSITFADPIEWDITESYTVNKIVIDQNGNAYLSKQAVPSGIDIDNEDYWLEIFNFTEYVSKSNKNLTVNFEYNTNKASQSYNVDAWLIWNEVLYRVTASIAEGQTLIVNTNVEHFTVEQFLKDFIITVNQTILQYKNDIDVSELAYKNEIDASELAYKNQLDQAIANTTATLSAQLAAAISGVTVDSEVIDARVGSDGVTYTTLGNAIRGQTSDIKKAIVVETIPDSEFQINKFINTNAGTISNANGWVAIAPRLLENNKSYLIKPRVKNDISSIYWLAYTENGTYLGYGGVLTGNTLTSEAIFKKYPTAYKIGFTLDCSSKYSTLTSSNVAGWTVAIFDSDSMEVYKNLPLYFQPTTGYYDGSGNFNTYSDIFSAVYPVAAGDVLRFTGYNYYNMQLIGFFASDDSWVSGVNEGYGNVLVSDLYVTVPATATKMIVQCKGRGFNAEVLKFIGRFSKPSSVLRNKKVTLIGDSITEYNFRARKNWSMFFEEWTGVSIQNLGHSGSGFAKGTTYGNYIPTIQDNPDLIGVGTSWNDLTTGLPIGTASDHGDSTVCGYINDFFDDLITAYPNTPIICYASSPWEGCRYGDTNTDTLLDLTKEICALHGVPFYDDLYRGSVLKPWIAANRYMYFTSDNWGSSYISNIGQVDNIHPNTMGHREIARILLPHFVDNVIQDGLEV